MNRYILFLSLVLLIVACDSTLLFRPEEPTPTGNVLTTRLALRPDTETISEEELSQIRDILMMRLAALELNMATVEIDGDVIIVELPEVEDFELVSTTLTENGSLEFVDFAGVTSDFTGQRINTTLMQYDDGITHPMTSTPFETILTGNDFQTVKPYFDTLNNSWSIEFTFQEEAGQIFGAFTERHIGERIGIVLNGEVLSAPTVQGRLDTVGVISGNFTEDEVRRLAIQLLSQSLPFPLVIENIEKIE